MDDRQRIREYTATIIERLDRLEAKLKELEDDDKLNRLSISSTDTTPTDDDSLKKLSIRRNNDEPANAAYIEFSNNPGTKLFLTLEDAD